MVELENFRPLGVPTLTFDRHSYVTFLLPIRIVCLALVIIINIFHVKTILVFKMEQILSSGTYVSYIIILFGMVLAMCLGRRLNVLLEVYFLAVGIVLFATIGIYILMRWRDMDHLTEAIAQLLELLGNPIKKNNIYKAIFSIVISLTMLCDLVITVYFLYN